MPKPPIFGPLLPFPEIGEPDFQKAAKKASYYASLTGLAVLAAPKFPKTATTVLELTVGLSVTAKRVVKVKPLFILNAAPSPIGVVPPEFYLLPPGLDDTSKIIAVFRKDGGSLEYLGQFYDNETATAFARQRQVADQLKSKSYSQLKFERDQFNDTRLSGDLGPLIRQAYADEIAARERLHRVELDFEWNLATKDGGYLRWIVDRVIDDERIWDDEVRRIDKLFAANPADP